MKRVQIYTDGSARGNPGKGGYGAVLEYRDSSGRLYTKEISGGYRCTTNNRMELMAVIAAVEELRQPCEIELFSDSQYIINAFNKGWVYSWLKKGWVRGKNDPVKNVDLWKRLLKDIKEHDVTWNWVKGHSGHSQNERCDALATQAADSDHLMEDRGYEPD